jgi:hypothetical protein
MRDASLDLRHLLLHVPAKFRLEPGLVQLLYGRMCQIEPTGARLGMMQLGSMVGVPVVMRITSIIRVVISLLMICFAVPMLLTIERLTGPLRFVLTMFHAVTIPTLL